MIPNKHFQIVKHSFDNDLSNEISDNVYVDGLWPLVYILTDDKIKEAYVGETSDAISRMSNHLKNNKKKQLTTVHFITSDVFNKSATLDIESNLIRYLSADTQYKLMNGNIGLANHSYYQKKEIYWEIFKNVWKDLILKGVAKNSLENINNSNLFKFSPYKSLSSDQKASLVIIMKGLMNSKVKSIIVEGGAGTGKSVLAIFLFKLLNSDDSEFDFKEFGTDEKAVIKLVRELRKVYPNPTMALVVPMSSFRSTLKKVFKNIHGLNAKMVIGPAEVANKKFDIIIVDESHRLRQRVNLGAYFGAFDKANVKLKLDKFKSNELAWMEMQGKKQIYFYDANQSIKPSDVNKSDFDKLKAKSGTQIQTLKSQFRVDGGNDYVAYIDKLLNCNLKTSDLEFQSQKYEFLLFHSLNDMKNKIQKREAEFGLSRLVAGFSWEWKSNKNKEINDIEIGNIKLRWNSISDDWVNTTKLANEVGCIHTTQGYDLNYTGIIFGNEISYDKVKKEVIIREDQYFDLNGKKSIKDPATLKSYILNIYKTMMLRGIKGTYIYVCDENLREYFGEHMAIYSKTKTSVPL